MKFALLALFALLPLVVAQVPIPYTNCGVPTDHIKISSASANVWPPVPGQVLTVTIDGAMDETLTGGSYIVNVALDGFPLVNQQGNLADLNITFPIAQGPFSLTKAASIPSVVPGGSTLTINGSALDSNGQELLCLSITFVTPSEDELDRMDQASTDASIFPEDDAVAPADVDTAAVMDALVTLAQDLTQKAPVKQMAADFLNLLSGELKVLADRIEESNMPQDSVPVPYTNCGNSTDEITILSITSNEWPPVLGTTAALNIAATASTQINDGTYTAVVSVDGFPLINKSGDISKYFKLPILAGPVNIFKNITLPSSLPFSGTIGIQLSADDNNSNEMFCLQLSLSI